MHVVWSHGGLVLLSHVAGTEPHVRSAWWVPGRRPLVGCARSDSEDGGQALAPSWVPRASVCVRCVREHLQRVGKYWLRASNCASSGHGSSLLDDVCLCAFCCSLHCSLKLKNVWWVLFGDFC